jgi:uncharacterized metal-binding protein
MKRNKVIDETISQASLFYDKATELNIIGSLLLIGYGIILFQEQINEVMNIIKLINLKEKK